MSDPIAEGYEALQDKYLRALAEVENLRKRTERDIAKARSQATADTLRVLLPIVDDLERAVAAQENNEAIRYIANKAQATLATLDVVAFETVGKVFTAELMEAIELVPIKAPDIGKVASEITRGYRIGDKLLRPAQVAVSCKDDG